MKKLSDLTFDLDCEMGAIESRIETLIDVNKSFLMLVNVIDNKVHRNQEALILEEWHRELRVLSELMRYSIKDLQQDYKKADSITGSLFRNIKKA
ncbi:hypothetical protein [Sporosarcina obsidiansis]|uniref:hypothetical protein n=1 Tax=Sporosarcina obsidiansis TaxID=2660748 RepID=UPI00129B2F2C|nr:hypothetical protein [Sporosarcina obsidiansis]